MSAIRFRMRPGMTRRVAAALAAAWIFVVSVALPAANAGMFSFDLKDEKELGEKFNTLIRTKMPLIQDTEVDEYVVGLVQRLVRTMPPQPFPFTVSVIANNAVNAFAGPAGYVFIFTGLLIQMEHESEVAAVLAHELAHVSQRHIAKRVGEMQALSIGQLIGVLAGVVLGATTQNYDLGGAVVMGSQAAAATAYLKYSRDDEREADQVGMNYLVAAGYRPQGLVGAFEIMQRLKWMQGGGDIPTYMSTHPGLVERMSYLKDRIKLLPADILNRKDNDTAFKRAQTLVRARYTDPKNAVAYYRKLGDKLTDLDRIGLAIAPVALHRGYPPGQIRLRGHPGQISQRSPGAARGRPLLSQDPRLQPGQDPARSRRAPQPHRHRRPVRIRPPARPGRQLQGRRALPRTGAHAHPRQRRNPHHLRPDTRPGRRLLPRLPEPRLCRGLR